MTYTQLEALKNKIIFSERDCIYIFKYGSGIPDLILDSSVDLNKLVRALFRSDLAEIKYIDKEDLLNIVNKLDSTVLRRLD